MCTPTSFLLKDGALKTQTIGRLCSFIYLVIMYIMTQVATIQHVGITYYYFMMEVLEPTTIKRMILKQMICAM